MVSLVLGLLYVCSLGAKSDSPIYYSPSLFQSKSKAVAAVHVVLEPED